MVPEIIWENFGNIIIETQRRILDPNFTDMIRYMNPVHAGMELCTVALNPGRRTGKTRFIRKWAGREDIVIVPDRRFKQNCYASYYGNVLYASQYESWEVRGQRPHTVYVDEPAMVFKEMAQYDLYNRFCHSGHIPLFILLGRCI